MCKLLVSDFEFHYDSVSITVGSAKNDQYRAGANVTLAAIFHDLSICPVTIARSYFEQLKLAGCQFNVFV